MQNRSSLFIKFVIITAMVQAVIILIALAGLSSINPSAANGLSKSMVAALDSAAAGANSSARATLSAGLADMESRTARAARMLRALILAVLVLGAGGMVLFRLGVSRPLAHAARTLEAIIHGDGDLTRRIEVRSQGEIGRLSLSINAFTGKLHDIIGNIISYFETVSASANQLLIISKQMDDGVGDMGQRSDVVARSAGEMSQNMHSVAAASEEAATNVQLVAEAMEQMSQAAARIADSSLQARNITGQAVAESRRASEKVDGLDRAAAEISKVTQMIEDISDQTNLLALNATIEAARAGDAGKGFAVVAGEIKELAGQTVKATQNIKNEVQSIQASTTATVDDISRISKVISEVDTIVSNIADAVAGQTGTTTQVADNISQASLGISEVNEKVAQSSGFAREIADDIGEVHRVVGAISKNSQSVSGNAEKLTRMASDLKLMVGEFKVAQAEVAEMDADTTSDIIVWDDDFAFGIDAIDRQHRRLVAMINELYSAMSRRAGKGVLARILDELTQYTVDHFKMEEAWMARANYPDLTSHKQVHQSLLAQVIDFRKQFDAGSATITLDLMNFLSDWLINHIKGVDRRYVPHLKNTGDGKPTDRPAMQRQAESVQ